MFSFWRSGFFLVRYDEVDDDDEDHLIKKKKRTQFYGFSFFSLYGWLL